MSGLLTGLVGACVEAWAELRIHRTRVLLSLIGVAVAVAAITGVAGVAGLAEQAQRENIESQGRPASFYISAYSEQQQLDAAAVNDAFFAAIDRYGIGFAARTGYADGRVQFADGVSTVGITTSDPDFGVMHRMDVANGRWFTEPDERRLAPAVIINEAMWQRIGSPDLASHPTVEIVGDLPTVAVVVGVLPHPGFDDTMPQMHMLYSAWERIAPPELVQQNVPSYEMWVPPDNAEELGNAVKRDMQAALGKGSAVEIGRIDFEGQNMGEDPLLPFKLVVGGIAGLVLFLGALSLVNISIVTLQQRIREIGIRRSFGATAGRVFFAVMMESVVGTIVAGFVGVMIAVAVVSNDWVHEQVAAGIQDEPAFPVDAAILGLVCATAVGALAGLLPALLAVRVKVIDAIRY